MAAQFSTKKKALHLSKRALEILRKDGPLTLAKQFRSVLWRDLYITGYYKPKMLMKYGARKPLPNEILVVDPARIEYRISRRYLPDNRPPHGIIGGDWDLQKSHWKDEGLYDDIDNRVFYGLVQRFAEGNEWEDTVYYQTGIERINAGKSFSPLSYSQTVSGLKKYLQSLDNLYADIKENGYDMSSVITAQIGRNGELMVIQGQHRVTIARIIGVEKIPVRIQYRHDEWEALRTDIYNNGLPKERTDELRDHPDLQNVLP